MGESELQKIKVVIMGDSGVGKTLLSQSYLRDNLRSWDTGLDILTGDIKVGKISVTTQVWDTSGDERFCEYWSRYFQKADCCVLVFSLTDPRSFISLEKWKSLFLTKCQPKIPQKFPFVIVGNGADNPRRQIPPEWTSPGYISWFSDEEFNFCIETSARLNVNVDKCFRAIVERAVRYRHLVMSLEPPVDHYFITTRSLCTLNDHDY